MNPMYPAPSFAHTFHSFLTLALSLGMLLFVAWFLWKIVPSKALRRLRDGLDLHAARTGYGRGMADAGVHQEHLQQLAEVEKGIAALSQGIESIGRAVTAAERLAGQALAEVRRNHEPQDRPQATERSKPAPRAPRRRARALVPATDHIPFVSTRPLGLSLP